MACGLLTVTNADSVSEYFIYMAMAWAVTVTLTDRLTDRYYINKSCRIKTVLVFSIQRRYNKNRDDGETEADSVEVEVTRELRKLKENLEDQYPDKDVRPAINDVVYAADKICHENYISSLTDPEADGWLKTELQRIRVAKKEAMSKFKKPPYTPFNKG